MEKLVEGCLPLERPHTGAGEESEEEGAGETTRDELTTTLIPRPPVMQLRGRR